MSLNKGSGDEISGRSPGSDSDLAGVIGYHGRKRVEKDPVSDMEQ